MTTFTAKAVDVADALANVIPHTDTNAALPVLQAVQVDVAPDGLVTFAATDRFTLGTQEVVSYGYIDIEPGVFLVHRGDAADVVKMAKAAKLGWLTFAHNGLDLTVTAPGMSLTSLTRRTIDGDFPKWRPLLPDGDPVAVEGIGLGAAHISKFAKLQRGGATAKNAALVLTFRGATKPVDVRVGDVDGFRAIVMPVRLQK